MSYLMVSPTSSLVISHRVNIDDYGLNNRLIGEDFQELTGVISQRFKILKNENRHLKIGLIKQKQHKDALVKSNNKLHALTGQLIQSLELERKRIACDLHDSIGQSLGAIKFKVEEISCNEKIDQGVSLQLVELIKLLKLQWMKLGALQWSYAHRCLMILVL